MRAEDRAVFSPERLEEVRDHASEPSALRMAYLKEKDAAALYANAARETDDPSGNAVYEAVAAREKGRQGVLEETCRFLAGRVKLDRGFAPLF